MYVNDAWFPLGKELSKVNAPVLVLIVTCPADAELAVSA